MSAGSSPKATPADALAELQRERGIRFGYYPKQVAAGRLSQRVVDQRAAALDLAITIVRATVEAEQARAGSAPADDGRLL
ncbi:MAG: hypothetical protein MUF14_05270 [Hyphomonadaceae bacterium]|jgi:hypothetical protein|nr:hypothetical protein [Hyphomonadaceae bacterium]